MKGADFVNHPRAAVVNHWYFSSFRCIFYEIEQLAKYLRTDESVTFEFT